MKKSKQIQRKNNGTIAKIFAIIAKICHSEKFAMFAKFSLCVIAISFLNNKINNNNNNKTFF